jgi:hypothetical protein
MNADERGFICRKKAQKAQRWGERPREPARQEPRPTGCGSPSRAPSVVSTERPLNPPHDPRFRIRSASNVNSPPCGAVQDFKCSSETSCLESIRLWVKATPILVHNLAIRLNGNGDDIFLNFNGVLVFSLAVEELPQPRHLVINDLLLCFQLGFKNNVTILIADQRDWSLAKRVDENAVPGAKV